MEIVTNIIYNEREIPKKGISKKEKHSWKF